MKPNIFGGLLGFTTLREAASGVYVQPNLLLILNPSVLPCSCK
ncbi:hypothetical protein [Nostoc sp.]